MKLLILSLMAVSSAMVVAAPSGGGKGKPSGPPPLSPEVVAKYDTNGDGKLDDAEKAAMKAALEAERQAMIAKYDTNGDGVLDETERKAMQAALEAQHLAELQAKFAALDTDASGGLSLAEFTAGAPKGAKADQIKAAFTRLDTSKDSSISLEEFTAKPKPPAKPPGKK